MSHAARIVEGQRLARRGKMHEALQVLRAHANDPRAAASLAELLAFTGEWDAVTEHVLCFFQDLHVAYAGDVFLELLSVLARAAAETERWDQTWHQVAAVAPVILEHTREHMRWAVAAQLGNLKEFCASRGRSRDIQDIPIVRPTPPESLQSRTSAYERAIADVGSIQPELRTEADRASYFLSLAMSLDLPFEAAKWFAVVKGPILFNDAVYVASHYWAQGDERNAWDIIVSNVPNWYPVDPLQVAPLKLLIELRIRSLMTVERCRHILSVPRGGETI